MNSKLEMRRLKSTDLFLMTKIISKIGLKQLKDCFNDVDISKLMENLKQEETKQDDMIVKVGATVVLNIADVIVSNLDKCEKEIHQMLANTDVKVIKELDIVEFMELIVEFLKKEEFKDFIKVASKFIK